MREVKFLAFLKKEQVIVNVAEMDLTNKVVRYYDTSHCKDGAEEFEFLRSEAPNAECMFWECELMQYTGSKDSNGVDIYLGNIVKREFEVWNTHWEGSIENNDLAPYEEMEHSGYFIGVVSQTPSGLYVLNKCNKFDAEGKFVKKRSNVNLYAHRCEVIGNIYENSDLLEVNK